MKDAIPAGINRMVLLDEQLLPVSERLYFSTNYQTNEIKIKPDKRSYETRSRVRLRLSDGPGMDNESWSNLSMVVVDDFANSKKGPSMNTLSWLLINSELKGFIESPLDYFSDDPDLVSSAKLNLLMMTQAWSKYVWSKPEEYLASESTEKEGFCLSGNVTKLAGNKPVIGGFAGVRVSKDYSISIRGTSSFGAAPPLFLLNGTLVDKEVFLNLPMNDIDRVEVIKNPGETAIFGTRGGSGVISVSTKKGGAPDYSDKYIPGTIAEKLKGYSSYREFYSPGYTDETIRSEKPDHRIVQFWEPNIFTEKGKASLTFFSSDDISRYKVYVEGITREGRICLGTATFEVKKFGVFY